MHISVYISVFPKIKKKIAVNKIYSFVNKHNLITSSLYSFRQGFSTETVECVQYIYDKMDVGECIV